MDNIIYRVCSLYFLTVCLLSITGAEQKDIRLTGGDSLNKGLLEVSKNGVWGNVCDEDWNMLDKDVACRHLGYLNASSVTVDARRYGNGNARRILMQDVRCDGDEDSLWDCEYNRQPNCNRNEYVSLVCMVPGYLGCYEYNTTEWFLSDRPTRHFRSSALTIEHCLDFCNEEGFPIAGLQNKADCYCETDKQFFDLNRKAAEVDCSLRCTGSKDQACGGIQTRSIYNVSAGFCRDNLEAPVGGWLRVESTFFGQTVTFGCNNGVQLIGNDVIQCVLGDSPNEVRWNAPAPYCLGATAGSITPAHVDAAPEDSVGIFEGDGILFWSVGAVAALLLIALVLITATMGIQRFNAKRRFRHADDTSVDFDLEPAGPSGTYRHSIHSLHMLGQMQDNDENNMRQEEQVQQQQQQVPQYQQPAIYLREEVKGGVGMQANELAVFGLQNSEDLEWDEELDSQGELDSDLEVDPRTSSIEYVGRTAL